MEDRYTKLNIIWSMDNPGTFQFLVSKIAEEALAQPKCEQVQITLFGPTVKLAAYRESVRSGLARLMAAGVCVTACEASVDEHKVRAEIENFGGIVIKRLAKRAVDDASGPDEKIVMV